MLKLDSASIATLRLAVVNSNLYSLFLAVLLNTAGLYRLFALSLRMGRSRTLVAGNVLSMSLKSLHWLDWYIGGNVAQSWLQQVELHSIETAKVGDVLGCTLFKLPLVQPQRIVLQISLTDERQSSAVDFSALLAGRWQMLTLTLTQENPNVSAAGFGECGDCAAPA